jgi:hypothetical protein
MIPSFAVAIVNPWVQRADHTALLSSEVSFFSSS